ncbi:MULTISPECIES: flavodoxin [Bifidobacterium]|uniref:Flavodoxin n=1 Tax=Bifidobacterium reuteri DSM 23975 TaxID=1437610 RepID=A0A087CPL4_9BIFI|nr:MULTISPECIES: flavodoxin [Bifidobacterium]KFI85214.1 flavodoxin [Bifidobacterium reuteri DSM 23975]TPF77794.1 flavodoxin [Bifidobacterium sp. UTCIF-1]TPF80072.1 flavodoxin [Bifidobacterium sp. UTCIF-24]TPF81846.1 flavodoxin [Bifidobacterium sp. UTCIF-3]TPF84079.1 flavodoxin [Bifidobacterium sp. UTCIF-36]
MGKRILVTYFSATGTTRAVAERLAKAAGADIEEIVPAEPYTAADVDWRDPNSRSSVEHQHREMRPELAHSIDITPYDVVFVGYPLWWETAPRVVRTFLESEDWSGKTIVTFATSGSSIRGADGVQLHDSAPAAHWIAGRRLAANVKESELDKWVAGLDL